MIRILFTIISVCLLTLNYTPAYSTDKTSKTTQGRRNTYLFQPFQTN